MKRICKRLVFAIGIITIIPMMLVFAFCTLRWIFTGKPSIEVLDWITDDWLQR